jgi:hypothetical protein
VIHNLKLAGKVFKIKKSGKKETKVDEKIKKSPEYCTPF